MSEEKTVYDFLMEARSEVAAERAAEAEVARLKAALEAAGARLVLAGDQAGAGAVVRVLDEMDNVQELREVEYEWNVVHAASGEVADVSTGTDEETARLSKRRLESEYGSTYALVRRPVGEWERVDG